MMRRTVLPLAVSQARNVINRILDVSARPPRTAAPDDVGYRSASHSDGFTTEVLHYNLLIL